MSNENVDEDDINNTLSRIQNDAFSVSQFINSLKHKNDELQERVVKVEGINATLLDRIQLLENEVKIRDEYMKSQSYERDAKRRRVENSSQTNTVACMVRCLFNFQ